MKKYNVIYADPPWTYDNKKTGGTMESGAEKHYSLMSNDDIANMPVKDLCQKDSILFIWATVPLMPEAFKVIDGWGFTYKTMLTWRKIMSQGMGYWFRGQCEHLLVATKGSPKAFRQQVCNYFESEYDPSTDHVYQHKTGKHSQKPHYFRELISKAVTVSFEHPEKLELFARSRDGFFPDYEYEGWDVFGNQVNNSIELPKAI